MQLARNNLLDRIIPLVAGFLLCTFAGPVEGIFAWQVVADPDRESIELLIQQLDDDSYRVRESAEKSLINLGFPAARLLVERVFSEKPEIAIRSGRVLSEMATRAQSEDELLRLAGVLEYLSRNGLQQYANSARQAISRWKEGRAEKVRELIRKTGIALETQGVVAGGGMIFAEGLAEFSNQEFAQPSVGPESAGQPGEPESRPREELLADIDLILNGEEKSIIQSLTDNTATDIQTDSEMSHTRFFMEGGEGARLIVRGGAGLGAPLISGQPTIARIDKITAETIGGIRLMRELNTVHQIVLEDCEVSDELIRELETVPGLQSIVITRCQYNPGTFLDLETRMPYISIYATGHEAFLGISAQEEKGYDSNGEEIPRLEVLTVVEESAAAEAGIQVGDTVLSIDGIPVSRHDQMVLCIASHKPGDVLIVKIKTGEGEREIEATLKTRPAGM
jgi:PDZ domain